MTRTANQLEAALDLSDALELLLKLAMGLIALAINLAILTLVVGAAAGALWKIANGRPLDDELDGIGLLILVVVVGGGLLYLLFEVGVVRW